MGQSKTCRWDGDSSMGIRNVSKARVMFVLRMSWLCRIFGVFMENKTNICSTNPYNGRSRRSPVDALLARPVTKLAVQSRSSSSSSSSSSSIICSELVPVTFLLHTLTTWIIHPLSLSFISAFNIWRYSPRTRPGRRWGYRDLLQAGTVRGSDAVDIVRCVRKVTVHLLKVLEVMSTSVDADLNPLLHHRLSA
jgi:hypothetical protein